MRRLEIAQLADSIESRYDPASGPGGQNVNKVATRATLLFDFEGCPHLTPPQRQRLRARYARRLTRDGRLQVASQRARTQSANRALAEQRLLELVQAILVAPPPRKPTQPTRAAKRRRLVDKRRRGEVKQRRRAPPE